MGRFLLIVLLALSLAIVAFASTTFALNYFGLYPLFDANRKVLTANVLEVIKLLPPFLAFVASLITAAVSVHLVTLQNKSSRDIETFKTELGERLEAIKMRIALSTRSFEQMIQFLKDAFERAAEYQTQLHELDGGLFDEAAVRDLERTARIIASSLDPGSSLQVAYYKFLQDGMNISDLVRRTKKRSPTRLRQIWADRGGELAAKFEKLQPLFVEERKRIESEAVERGLRKTREPGPAPA